MAENFYLGTHMECTRSITFILLTTVYYKMQQLLQIAMIITNCDSTLIIAQEIYLAYMYIEFWKDVDLHYKQDFNEQEQWLQYALLGHSHLFYF